MSVEKLTAEATLDVAKLTAKTVKEIWSVLDAAAEKPAPSRYLSEKAVQAIQGLSERVQQGVRAVAEET